MKPIIALSLVAVGLGLASVALAQETASQPAPGIPGIPGIAPVPDAVTQPASTQSQATPLRITIDGVQGIVQYRVAEDQPWLVAAKGIDVPQGAQFRTGPRSAVRLLIHPNHMVTLDRLGTFQVLQAIEADGIIKTDVGMPYGRTRYNVEAGGPDHQTNIRSPGATLSIRGTDVGHQNEAGHLPSAFSNSHQATFTPAGGPPIRFGGNRFARVRSNDTPARLFMQRGTANPGHPAGTDPRTESHLLQHYPGMDASGHMAGLRDQPGLFDVREQLQQDIQQVLQSRTPPPPPTDHPGCGDGDYYNIGSGH